MPRASTEIATRLTSRLVFGLAVMILGLLLTLDNMDVMDAREYLRYWPVALIAVGLARLLQPADYPRVNGIIWLGLGVMFLLNSLDLVRIRQIWPLALLLVGGNMVWRAITSPGRRPRHEPVATAVAGSDGSEKADYQPPMTADDSFRLFALMGGVTRGTNARDFRGGEATATMGGCEIDLRKAGIAADPAVIDTFALWGGIEIYVPDDWEVVNRGFAVMGGFEDKTKRPVEPKGRLVVTGFALMGGVEISN
jgi:hypothetical protein